MNEVKQQIMSVEETIALADEIAGEDAQDVSDADELVANDRKYEDLGEFIPKSQEKALNSYELQRDILLTDFRKKDDLKSIAIEICKSKNNKSYRVYYSGQPTNIVGHPSAFLASEDYMCGQTLMSLLAEVKLIDGYTMTDIEGYAREAMMVVHNSTNGLLDQWAELFMVRQIDVHRSISGIMYVFHK